MNPALQLVLVVATPLIVAAVILVWAASMTDKPTLTDRLWLHVEAVHECELRARAWHENRGAEFNTDAKFDEHHYINKELDRLFEERKELLACQTH